MCLGFLHSRPQRSRGWVDSHFGLWPMAMTPLQDLFTCLQWQWYLSQHMKEIGTCLTEVFVRKYHFFLVDYLLKFYNWPKKYLQMYEVRAYAEDSGTLNRRLRYVQLFGVTDSTSTRSSRVVVIVTIIFWLMLIEAFWCWLVRACWLVWLLLTNS